MMVRKKNNSLITNSQENMDNFAETTSSLLQRDVDTATSLPSRLYTQDVNFELLEYRMKTLEESVRELKKEIQQPILKKIEKYKWILGISTTILLTLASWGLSLYNKNLEVKFDRLEEKHNESNKIIENQTKELSELKSKIHILEYALKIPTENK